jgi:hypothetical protein
MGVSGDKTKVRACDSDCKWLLNVWLHWLKLVLKDAFVFLSKAPGVIEFKQQKAL